jgi:dCMP deaminase
MADGTLSSERRSPEFWDRFFLDMAEHVATASRDPSTKVGCILADSQRRLVGMGYNGFPRGVNDLPERYEDRPTKYLMVQHAEANAVLQSPAAYLEGSTAYVTHPPCANCAGILIQAGIKRVVTYLPCPEMAKRFGESWGAASVMFSEAGISTTFLEPKVEFSHGEIGQ